MQVSSQGRAVIKGMYDLQRSPQWERANLCHRLSWSVLHRLSRHLLPSAHPWHITFQAFGQMLCFTSGKMGETLVLHSPICSCGEAGLRYGICKVDFIFRENISSSRGPPGPGEGGNPIEIRGGIKEQAFARREPWGSPAVGDLTPAHSHSWQSKAAWPGAESVYFFCCQTCKFK